MKYRIDKSIGKYDFHCAWRYNGVGFMLLWIGGLYIQILTIKIIITKSLPLQTLTPILWEPAKSLMPSILNVNELNSENATGSGKD